MATSGSYAYVSSTSTVINNAFAKIGRKNDFETLAPGDARYDRGLAVLNPLLLSNEADGMPLWAITDMDVPFNTVGLNTTAGILIGLGQVVNTVAPLKIIQALRRDNTQGIDVPMELYSYDDYQALSNKSSTGAPIGYFYQPLGPANGTSGRLKVWLLPDTYWTANGSINIRYQRPFQTQVATTDELDFPKYWIHPITYQLAYALAPDYGIDISQRAALKSDMEREVTKALGFGTEEGSLCVSPRTRW